MSGISWSEMMSVGVPVLDSDHKTLIGLVADLQRSIGDDEEYATLGSVLTSLADYTEHHFAREERVMEACRYPSLRSHIVMHHKLAQQVRDLQARYVADPHSVAAKDCLGFMHNWLIEHICSTDMDYRAWVVGNPAGCEAAASVCLTGPRPAGGGLDWTALRVLVVDDNSNFLLVMRTILEGIGVTEIHAASDLETARAVLAENPVDVVVTDWHVGRESGLDLVAWIRAQPLFKALPVVMLSGRERAASRDIAVEAGADEFMEKPISARGLLMCLAKLMADRRGMA